MRKPKKSEATRQVRRNKVNETEPRALIVELARGGVGEFGSYWIGRTGYSFVPGLTQSLVMVFVEA